MNNKIIETFYLTEEEKLWTENNFRENILKDASMNALNRIWEKEKKFYSQFPNLSKMTFYRFVYPEYITPEKYVLYSYENTCIFRYNGGPSIFFDKEFNEDNISELLYILSYLNILPVLTFLDNKEYTNKVFEMISIETNDFTEMLQIRYFKKSGLKNKIDFNVEDIIFKANSKNYVSFKKLSDPRLLALYHASLFQKDIAAKCVFLFRIIEYIKYNCNPNKLSFQKLIENYYSEAIRYRFQPIFGKKMYFKDGEFQKNDKEFSNYFQLLKKEAKKIYIELKIKYPQYNFGDIIYKVGRCSVSHGKYNDEPVSLHNFEKDLLEINDINIILELIARYSIEKNNPQLKNKIETRKKIYN